VYAACSDYRCITALACSWFQLFQKTPTREIQKEGAVLPASNVSFCKLFLIRIVCNNEVRDTLMSRSTSLRDRGPPTQYIQVSQQPCHFACGYIKGGSETLQREACLLWTQSPAPPQSCSAFHRDIHVGACITTPESFYTHAHVGTLREAPRPCSAKLACYADTSGALVLHNPAAYAPDGFSAKLAFGADTSGALLLHNPAAYAPEGFMSMLA
jgi:hypothetical protein